MKLAIILLAAAVAVPATALPARNLSDRDLKRLDARPFDKRAMMGKTVVLGRHHGVRVVANYPCSDVCPNYTVRIIHYDVQPGSECERAGGVTVTRTVPFGIGVVRKPFCAPKVLAGER